MFDFTNFSGTVTFKLGRCYIVASQRKIVKKKSEKGC